MPLPLIAVLVVAVTVRVVALVVKALAVLNTQATTLLTKATPTIVLLMIAWLTVGLVLNATKLAVPYNGWNVSLLPKLPLRLSVLPADAPTCVPDTPVKLFTLPSDTQGRSVLAR